MMNAGLLFVYALAIGPQLRYAWVVLKKRGAPMFKISSGAGVFALGLVLLVGAAAQAATVTFTLSIDDDGHGSYQQGLFAVYADVSKGDNGGLHGFGVDLKGPVSAIFSMVPAGIFTKAGLPTKWSGFTAAAGEDRL